MKSRAILCIRLLDFSIGLFQSFYHELKFTLFESRVTDQRPLLVAETQPSVHDLFVLLNRKMLVRTGRGLLCEFLAIRSHSILQFITTGSLMSLETLSDPMRSIH